jgi:SHS2 domain-containing protein
MSLRELMAADQEEQGIALDTKALRIAIDELQHEQEVAAELEATLKVRNARILELSTQTIPDLLDQAGVEALTLDGQKIEVKTQIEPHVKKDDLGDFFEWLREHNFDGIIKNSVVVEFGAKQDDKATALHMQLIGEKYDVTRKALIHPQTLKAFVKEQVEKQDQDADDAIQFPDVLTLHRIRVTNIK